MHEITPETQSESWQRVQDNGELARMHTSQLAHAQTLAQQALERALTEHGEGSSEAERARANIQRMQDIWNTENQ